MKNYDNTLTAFQNPSNRLNVTGVSLSHEMTKNFFNRGKRNKMNNEREVDIVSSEYSDGKEAKMEVLYKRKVNTFSPTSWTDERKK